MTTLAALASALAAALCFHARADSLAGLFALATLLCALCAIKQPRK